MMVHQFVHIEANKLFIGKAKDACRRAINEGALAFHIQYPDTLTYRVQQRLPLLLASACRHRHLVHSHPRFCEIKQLPNKMQVSSHVKEMVGL
jgi:hypothetical protein